MQDSEASLCWLCTAPDGRQGSHGVEAEARVFRASARTYVSWNDAALAIPAVQRLAERLGIEWDHWPADCVLALASVKPMFKYDDLALLDGRLRMQVNFYQDVASSATEEMFAFKIVHLWPLQCVVPCSQLACITFRCFFVDLDQDTFDRVSDQAEFEPAIKSCLPSEAIRLPRPFAVFCALSRWSEIVVCDAGRGGKGGWCLGKTCLDGDGRKVARFDVDAFQQRRAAKPNREVEELVVDFNAPEGIERFADVIREAVAPVLGELDDSVMSKLHHYMSAFACHASQLCGTLMMQSKNNKAKNCAYDMYYLMRCFFLCDSLTSPTRLKRALYDACSLLLPKDAATAVQQALDNEQFRLPSSSTISRLRGRVDVAWMMVWRQRLGKWLLDDGGMIVFLVLTLVHKVDVITKCW